MRYLLPVCAFLLASTGCADQRFSIKQRSCGDNFTKWGGGLTHHLLQGQKSTGVWNYDPDGLVVTNNTGSYNFITGDFSWDLDYHPDHWRLDGEVTGFGYADRNGDIDIEYELVTLDTLDNQWTIDVRERRVGCQARVVTTDSQGNVTDERGTYAAGQYVWERDTGNPDVSLSGVRRSDGTWTQEYELEGDYTHEATTEGDADGYSIETFVQQSGSTTFEGTVETFLDGTEHVAYSFDDGSNSGSWDYTIDYAGDGEGTFESNGDECDVDFDEGECTRTCDGTTSSC